MATVTRLYDNHETAQAVANDLKSNGFTDDHVTIWSRSAIDATNGQYQDGDHPSDPDLVAAFVADGASRQQASDYAKRVHQGAIAVSVRAPFGRASQATAIMDRRHTVPADPHDTDRSPTSGTTTKGPDLIDEPAPLSKLLGLPVLLKD